MNPSYNSGQMPQAPIISSGAGAQVPVGSGSGNVVLSGGANPEKKSHKGIIILVIFLVLALALGGVYALWQNGAFRNIGLGGGNGQVATANLEEAYNAYTNYVLFGQESIEKPNLEAMVAAKPYFEELETSGLEAYVTRADEKYGDLQEKFNKSYNGEEDVDITVLKSFFVDFARVRPLTEEEILAAYVRGGQEGARMVITNHYKTEEAGDSYMQNYLQAESGLAVTMLELIGEANAAGCVRNGELTQGCYTLSQEDGASLAAESTRVIDTRAILQQRAMNVLETLYENIYNSSEGGAE